eukprot:COSAG06_NODE_2419_length_6906_cov_2.885118_5_plen_230_part_00
MPRGVAGLAVAAMLLRTGSAQQCAGDTSDRCSVPIDMYSPPVTGDCACCYCQDHGWGTSCYDWGPYCTAGSYCNENSYYNTGPSFAGQDGSGCPACTEDGKHIAEGHAGTNCKPCAGNTYSTSRTATSCTECPAGKMSNALKTACEEPAEGTSIIKLRSVSPSACNAGTTANECMETLMLEIKDDVLTITPAESSCPGSVGIIDGGGEATGTSVRPRSVGCVAPALTRD